MIDICDSYFLVFHRYSMLFGSEIYIINNQLETDREFCSELQALLAEDFCQIVENKSKSSCGSKVFGGLSTNYGIISGN